MEDIRPWSHGRLEHSSPEHEKKSRFKVCLRTQHFVRKTLWYSPTPDNRENKSPVFSRKTTENGPTEEVAAGPKDEGTSKDMVAGQPRGNRSPWTPCSIIYTLSAKSHVSNCCIHIMHKQCAPLSCTTSPRKGAFTFSRIVGHAVHGLPDIRSCSRMLFPATFHFPRLSRINICLFEASRVS